jgi:hypothetical protein
MPPTTTERTIALSQPLFTLVDLAATLEPDPLEAAINEADRRDLIRADDIAAALHQMPLFPFGSTASRCP